MLATDTDDEARRLLDDGGSATGRGHLDIVRMDREVMANDAAELCWQCRSDPSRPNPACPHPAPPRPVPPDPPPALSADPARIAAWLAAPNDRHPRYSNAEAHGVDEELFGPGHEGYLSTVEDVLIAGPNGLTQRSDGNTSSCGSSPTATSPTRARSSPSTRPTGYGWPTLHQDLKDFADRHALGIPAATAALRHIASQASLVVATYQSRNPQYQPPRR